MMADQVGGRSALFSQHPNETLVRVMLVFFSNGSQGGHSKVEVDTYWLPLVCHLVTESLHQVLLCGNYAYG